MAPTSVALGVRVYARQLKSHPSSRPCADTEISFSGGNFPGSKPQAWLGGRDSNPDSQIQSLLSYR